MCLGEKIKMKKRIRNAINNVKSIKKLKAIIYLNI